MDNPPCIEISNVSKKYGNQKILDGVHLTVNSNEVHGLVGINGAGKTTLIKCLLDLVSINSGEIKLSGVNNTDTRSRTSLAFLPEKFTPPYFLTGRDFLKYILKLYDAGYDEQLIESVLLSLDFNPQYLSKPVRQLSKGMTQKLGLTACFLSNKKLLVLDEPMSGLDPRARAYLKQHIMDLKDQSITMFVCTHLLSDVEALCDKVSILHNGTIHFTGSPEECCRQYNTTNFEDAYLACVGG
ncbi:MAG: ABC transporter ATP-binding protein [Gammaproteobacteria bacterium]|nr:ABC transporter ATP-binding protein [Gammaproteobacteria bacterium]